MSKKVLIHSTWLTEIQNWETAPLWKPILCKSKKRKGRRQWYFRLGVVQIFIMKLFLYWLSICIVLYSTTLMTKWKIAYYWLDYHAIHLKFRQKVQQKVSNVSGSHSPDLESVKEKPLETYGKYHFEIFGRDDCLTSTDYSSVDNALRVLNKIDWRDQFKIWYFAYHEVWYIDRWGWETISMLDGMIERVFFWVRNIMRTFEC